MARWKYQFRVNLQYFPLEKPKTGIENFVKILQKCEISVCSQISRESRMGHYFNLLKVVLVSQCL